MSAVSGKTRILALLHKNGDTVTIVGHKVVTSFTASQAITLDIHSDDIDVDANSLVFWLTSPQAANDGLADPGGTVSFTLPN